MFRRINKRRKDKRNDRITLPELHLPATGPPPPGDPEEEFSLITSNTTAVTTCGSIFVDHCRDVCDIRVSVEMC